jgi:hypothetical protein
MFSFLDVITWIIPGKALLLQLTPPLIELPDHFTPQQDDGSIRGVDTHEADYSNPNVRMMTMMMASRKDIA